MFRILRGPIVVLLCLAANGVAVAQGKLVPQEVPSEFDYDFWLGHTQEVPYHEDRCHFWWRFNSRFRLCSSSAPYF